MGETSRLPMESRMPSYPAVPPLLIRFAHHMAGGVQIELIRYLAGAGGVAMVVWLAGRLIAHRRNADGLFVLDPDRIGGGSLWLASIDYTLDLDELYTEVGIV